MKVRSFLEGSIILRRVDSPFRAPEKGKLAPNWEGSYKIKQNLLNRAYKLKTIDGKPIPQTWNSTYLKAYYVQV